MTCAEMFLKRNIKATQELHPLFARGIKNKLTLQLTNVGTATLTSF